MRLRRVALTGALNLLVQAILVAVLYVTASAPLAGWTPWWRDVVLALVAVGQSAIWVVFFYLQDRRAPEPTGQVVASFVAGMAGASLVLVPFDRAVFDLRAWMYRSEASVVVGATCVRGALAALLIYGIVRYAFVPTDEFDEPVDGLAYGSFTGCGLAAVASLAYLADHPDFTLFAAAIASATNVLVYGSVGALVGYVVGGAKFSPRPAGPAAAVAVVAGAGLIGLYHAIVDSDLLAGSAHPLWAGAIAAAAFAAVVFGVATILMARTASRPAPFARPLPRFEIAPFLAGAVLLAIGSAAAMRAARPVIFTEPGGISLAYDPAAITSGPSGSMGRGIRSAFAAGAAPGLAQVFTARSAVGTTIAIGARAGTLALTEMDPKDFTRSPEPIALTVSDTMVAGHRAARLRYAYRVDATDVSLALPRLRWVVTDVVPLDARVYVLSFEGEPAAFASDESRYERLLASVSWQAP